LNVLFDNALLAAEFSEHLFVLHERMLVAHALAFRIAVAFAAAGAEHAKEGRKLLHAVRRFLNVVAGPFDLLFVWNELAAMADLVFIANLLWRLSDANRVKRNCSQQHNEAG
jgi:hypothetical protein